MKLFKVSKSQNLFSIFSNRQKNSWCLSPFRLHEQEEDQVVEFDNFYEDGRVLKIAS